MATIKYKDENGQWQEIAVGGGGGTAAEGTKLYPIYVPYFLETESLTTEQQQANADAVAAATNGDKIILELLLPDGLKAIVHSYSVMDGALILDLARSGVLNLSDYQAYVDMVILSADGSVAYDSHDVFELATKEYVDKAVANSGGGGGLEYLEFDDPTTADEVMSIISTIQQRYDTTGKMPVAWINGNGGHSLILQIIYQSERDGVLVTRLMDSEVMYFVTSGALLVVPSSLVMRLDASASDNNKMVAALLQLVSFTQWQMFNIPIYLEIDGVMYEAVGKSKESNGTVYGSFVVGSTLKIYKLTHSENGVFVPLLKSEIPLGGGGSIAVDDALSLESTNPVQNKVVTKEIEKIPPTFVVYFGDDIDDTQKQHNIDAFNSMGILMEEGRMFHITGDMDGLPIPCTLSPNPPDICLTPNREYYEGMKSIMPFVDFIPMYFTINSDGTLLSSADGYDPGFIPQCFMCITRDAEHFSRWKDSVATLFCEAAFAPLRNRTIIGSSDYEGVAFPANLHKRSSGSTLFDVYYLNQTGVKVIDSYDGSEVNTITMPFELNTDNTVIKELAYLHIEDGGRDIQMNGCMLIKCTKVTDGYNLTFFDDTQMKVYFFSYTYELTLVSETSLV